MDALGGLGPFLLPMIGVGLAMIPIVMLIVFASLALFMWSAKRIWPYPRAIGKWASDWRNFIPLVLVTLPVLIIMIALALGDNTIALLARFALFLFVGPVLGLVIFLAMIAAAVKSTRWLWPMYRGLVWGTAPWLWGLFQRGGVAPAEGLERKAVAVPRKRAVRAPKREELPRRALRGYSLRTAGIAGRLQATTVRFTNTIGGLSGKMTAVLSSSVQFVRRNALKLAFPLVLPIALAFVVLAVPFIPLMAVFMLPVLLISRVRDRVRGEGGKASGTRRVGAFAMPGISGLNRRIDAIIDRLMRLFHLK